MRVSGWRASSSHRFGCPSIFYYIRNRQLWFHEDTISRASAGPFTLELATLSPPIPTITNLPSLRFQVPSLGSPQLPSVIFYTCLSKEPQLIISKNCSKTVEFQSPTTVLKAQSFSRLSNLSSSYLLVSILNSWIPLLKDDHIRHAALRQLKTNTLFV
ncbi:hypothetical protein PCANC_21764 [Puccinia coronata f. sp. avenae]|uniref:Uncharacterized protein n=1 Tax=Puccinia coronata f. sp. avenae TaxID=200324 RepID=A0A2N5TUY0_9BASI|nr:hypothetical protein PCANC_21764 [Puccinia coronata f. sp. avenae]